MLRWRLIHLLFALCLIVGNAFAAAQGQVVLILNAQDRAHSEFRDALTMQLRAAMPTMDIAELDTATISAYSLEKSRVIVTVGSQAARAIATLAPTQAIIHTLIPASTHRDLPAGYRAAGSSTTIVLDQPAPRQIALLRLAFPDWQRIALLASNDDDLTVRELAEAARAQHFDVRRAIVESERELYTALQRTLAEPAILIATPDPQIYSSLTIQNVLLTAYRRRSPVLGFSAAYTRAGALLSLYSTPKQIGEQASNLVLRALRGGALPQVLAPSTFEVAINQSVARSLGIGLESAESLTVQLVRLEAAKP